MASLPPYSPAVHGAQAAAAAAAANLLGGLGGNKTVEKAPAGEFNHAIQFLNKIKTRYGDEPDTYKQFLEILQTSPADLICVFLASDRCSLFAIRCSFLR